MKSMFTYSYHQPDEYHFSLDSIHFAEYLAEHIQDDPHLSSMRVLDLCAGCGVIGLELSWYRPELQYIDFVEVQEIYTSYFEKNRAQVVRNDLITQWYCMNYHALLAPAWESKYDLIISNPPYFHKGQGILSPSEFKNRCRFYLDSTFTVFIKAIVNVLAVNGWAYFLARADRHGMSLQDVISECITGYPICYEIATQIRGTHVIQLKKTA